MQGQRLRGWAAGGVRLRRASRGRRGADRSRSQVRVHGARDAAMPGTAAAPAVGAARSSCSRTPCRGCRCPAAIAVRGRKSAVVGAWRPKKAGCGTGCVEGGKWASGLWPGAGPGYCGMAAPGRNAAAHNQCHAQPAQGDAVAEQQQPYRAPRTRCPNTGVGHHQRALGAGAAVGARRNNCPSAGEQADAATTTVRSSRARASGRCQRDRAPASAAPGQK